MQFATILFFNQMREICKKIILHFSFFIFLQLLHLASLKRAKKTFCILRFATFFKCKNSAQISI